MNRKRVWQFEGTSRFELDELSRTLRRDGSAVPLNRRAFDVLLHFLLNPGRPLGKEELLQSVWSDAHVDEGSLRQSISVLRRALGEQSEDSSYILTIPGRGYQFIAPVSEMVAETGNSAEQGVPSSSGIVAPEPAESGTSGEVAGQEHPSIREPEGPRAGNPREGFGQGLILL